MKNIKLLQKTVPSNRPYIFTSFVSTIDGKIMVKDKGYWPIGTKADYDYFTNLRAQADAIVDAKNTALTFGKYTIKTLNDTEFKLKRRNLEKLKQVEYIVLTTKPSQDLFDNLKNKFSFQSTILTNNEKSIDKTEFYRVENISTSSSKIEMPDLISYLNKKGHKTVFIDGGPSLISELLKFKMLDEIHLTIAPKIFGTEIGKTLTLAEGHLFSPDSIPNFRIEELKKVDDEIIVKYVAIKS